MRYAASLLEKLCPQLEAGSRRDVARGLSLNEAKASVALDLEALLNTRRPAWAGDLHPHALLARSVAAYGVDDFSSCTLSSGLDRDRICASIRQAVSSHESRLRSVQVVLDTDAGDTRQRLRFVIRALLVLSRASEPVSFDASFDPSVQRYAVGLARNA